jgi:aryl-alcohol dehydrogenase-like predicted oxidoreductase
MDVRKIGGTDLISSSIGLGCMAFTGNYGRIEEAEIISQIQQALDIGISMLDMADSYAGGWIEHLVGRGVTGRRDEAVIATRGGLRFDAAGRPMGFDSSPDHLRRACEASLRRLGVDYIDLYYLAGIDPNVPVEESIGELADLAAAGKIRHIGLTTTSAGQLRRGYRVHPIAAISGEYSLWERGIETECLPAARELGVTFVACAPLARGVLTGRLSPLDHYDEADGRPTDSRLPPESLLRLHDPLREAEQIAAQLHLGLARLALAWLLAQPDVVPIPSTRNPLHLEMNAAAVGVRLPPGQYERLAEIFSGTASGGH